MINFQNVLASVNDFFVPRDGLRQQAQDLISIYDVDGDNRINVTTGREDQHVTLPGFFGAGARSFVRADAGGNDNGVATLREVRNLLKQYDTGNVLPDTAGDRHLDGIEVLRFAHDMASPRPTQSTTQATAGVQWLAR
ncbi:MAG: hypothetical protein JWN72_888 [Thermoleophilia bacterium]|nr:hypothetical protein [Thermoleophilia bacterium]